MCGFTVIKVLTAFKFIYIFLLGLHLESVHHSKENFVVST